MAKVGRPRVPAGLTDEVRAKIIEAIRKGNYRCVAAQHAGVNQSALSRWMTKGKRDASGVYHDFRKAVLEAENAAEIEAVGFVRRAAEGGDVKAAQWFLERKFPDRWGANRDQLKALKRELDELKAVVCDAGKPAEKAGQAPPS